LPKVAVRDIAIQPRDGDLLLATHGRGIYVVDDLTPLRNLSVGAMDNPVTMLPGRPVQQRIRSGGGWVDGDAVYVGDNPADGAVISYYLKSRQVIGKLSVDVLDANGKVVDTLPAGKRRGLNRVTWSMLTSPPLVPPAAQIAGNAAQGPRALPGRYTVRLTRAGKVTTMPLVVGLDRRAKFTLADRQAQFAQATRVKGLFSRMSLLVERITALRDQAAATSTKVAAGDPLRAQLTAYSGKAESLRKLVVATSEGGAITGEQRLREDTADVYGAIMSTEGRPTPYAVARVGVLDRELGDVEKKFGTLSGAELRSLNGKLKAKSLPPLTVPSSIAQDDVPVDGGNAAVSTIFRGLVGTRVYGTIATSADRDR
ncbi:MAG TPA: hypothetical protein VGN14_14205, partial [Candidatus Elarobacter sp.]